MKTYILFLFFGFGIASPALGKTVTYELNIEKKIVNLSGKKDVDFALSVNGGIPAPTLEFTEGDEAVITVTNKLSKEETSIHWHGILLPPEMDGVPYVNTPPIMPGQSFTFKFKIRQHGTYWYHSHTMLQEQRGVYGAFVIHPKNRTIAYDKDLVVILSDWSDENADSILNNLKKDGDYYQYKKGSMRSYWGAIRAGKLGTMLGGEWTRMGGMDLSDVGYDAFLINGRRDSQLLVAHPGERIRLRIINAGASTYFYVSLGGLPMQVISADGADVQPVLARELLMGMAETYDVIFSVPEHKNYELRATSQDVMGYASGWVGMGEKVAASHVPAPNLYMGMDHGAHEMDSHSAHQVKAPAKTPAKSMKIVERLTVDDYRSVESTVLPKDNRVYDLKLVLGGDMERYVWHINGKAIHQDRNIEVNEGDVVRLTFENDTMMHHPMHLHGHLFRVLNGGNDHSPLKHTVDIPPHSSRTIEFLANERGEWMLHCHNLFHIKTGMARFIKYKGYEPSLEMKEHAKHDPHLHDHIYYKGSVGTATNFAQIALGASRTWDGLELRLETKDYDDFDHADGDLLYRRWFSRYFSLLGGAIYAEEYEEDKVRAALGFGYTLPLLFEIQAFVDHKGEFRLDVEKRFQWTQYFYSDAEIKLRENVGTDYLVSLMYAPNWEFSIGLTLNETGPGLGALYRF